MTAAVCTEYAVAKTNGGLILKRKILVPTCAPEVVDEIKKAPAALEPQQSQVSVCSTSSACAAAEEQRAVTIKEAPPVKRVVPNTPKPLESWKVRLARNLKLSKQSKGVDESDDVASPEEEATSKQSPVISRLEEDIKFRLRDKSPGKLTRELRALLE